MVTAWQCPWATCEPQVALPLLGNLACWGSQNQQPPALLRTLKKRRKKGCQRVGPSLGPQTYVTEAKQNISCLKPKRLETAEAHSPVVTAWQCPWATCDPQVALPLLRNPACWGQSEPIASSSAETAKIQVSRSRNTPTWKPKFA